MPITPATADLIHRFDVLRERLHDGFLAASNPPKAAIARTELMEVRRKLRDVMGSEADIIFVSYPDDSPGAQPGDRF